MFGKWKFLSWVSWCWLTILTDCSISHHFPLFHRISIIPLMHHCFMMNMKPLGLHKTYRLDLLVVTAWSWTPAGQWYVKISLTHLTGFILYALVSSSVWNNRVQDHVFCLSIYVGFLPSPEDTYSAHIIFWISWHPWTRKSCIWWYISMAPTLHTSWNSTEAPCTVETGNTMYWVLLRTHPCH